MLADREVKHASVKITNSSQVPTSTGHATGTLLGSYGNGRSAARHKAGARSTVGAPPSQRIGNFDIANATVPALHVSGDFVATFEQDGSWFLALGDLMGKGLPAAMWLTHVLDLLRRSCETGQTLPGIMQSPNREMHRSRVGVPLTSLFLARLDQAGSCLTYSYSCGGCPPALC
jgi:Stage II sporulation protein E (SpoIIE)